MRQPSCRPWGSAWLCSRPAKLRVQAAAAWADIEVLPKRRHALIPKLVDTVQGVARHGQTILAAVIQARGSAIAARSPAQPQQAEQPLAACLGQLFALAEAYPERRVLQTFRSMQDSLGQIKEALQSAHRYYNAVVRDLTTAIARFRPRCSAGGL